MSDHDTLGRELRAALHELADDHVPPPLPRDLWQRGRAPLKRSWRPSVVAAAVVLVALLAAVSLLQRPELLPPAKAPGDGALPTEVWVPSAADVAAEDVAPLDVVGRASLTTPVVGDVALLVDARDGEHQLRRLTGLESRGGLPSSAVALSPDGTQLAYAFREDDGTRESTLTGVRVADLVDGGQQTLPLAAPATAGTGLPVRVKALQWAPDGSSLAWTGAEFEPAEGETARPDLVGVLDVDSGRGRTWELPKQWSANVLTPTLDGGLVVADQKTLWQLSEDAPEGVLDRSTGRALPDVVDNYERQTSPLSPDGSAIAATAYVEDLPRDLLTAEIDLDERGLPPRLRSWGTHEFSGGGVLGWATDAALLVVTAEPTPRIQRGRPDPDEYDVLTTVHIGGDRGTTSFSVAARLGSADPVAFPAPAWAPGPSPWLVCGLLGGALLVAAWLFRHSRGRARDTRRELRGWLLAVALTAGGVWLAASGELSDLSVGWVLAAACGVALLLATRARVRPGRGAAFRVLVLGVALGVALAPWWPRAGGPTTDEPELSRTVHTPTSYGADEQPDSWPTIEDLPTGRASSSTYGYWSGVTLVDAHDGTHHLRQLSASTTGGARARPSPS